MGLRAPSLLSAVATPTGGLALAQNAAWLVALLEFGDGRQQSVLVVERIGVQGVRDGGEALRVQQDGAAQTLPVSEQRLNFLGRLAKLFDDSDRVGAALEKCENCGRKRPVGALSGMRALRTRTNTAWISVSSK